MEVENLPIEYLINYIYEYYKNHSISNGVKKDELAKVISNYIATLKKYGITTIGKFVHDVDHERLEKFLPLLPEYKVLFEEALNHLLSKNYEKEESDFFGTISIITESKARVDDLSVISIDDLEIASRTKTVLKRWADVYNLQQLLDMDYEQIRQVRNLGEIGIKELINYIHSLGYSIKGEELSIKEKYKEIEVQGTKLIQDELDINNKVVGLLNRNGIFTLQDLIDFGEDVYKLARMGPVKERILKEALQKKNIDLSKKESESKKDDLSMISIDDLEVASRTKTVLKRWADVYNLQQLLDIDYEEIKNVRNLGEKGIAELLDYIHSLGYSIKGEEAFIKENIDLSKKKSNKEGVSMMPDEDVIEKLKEENASIKERIDKKEELLKEYNNLIQEREELLRREKELDKVISEKTEILLSLKNKEEGNYGRR